MKTASFAPQARTSLVRLLLLPFLLLALTAQAQENRYLEFTDAAGNITVSYAVDLPVPSADGIKLAKAVKGNFTALPIDFTGAYDNVQAGSFSGEGVTPMSIKVGNSQMNGELRFSISTRHDRRKMLRRMKPGTSEQMVYALHSFVFYYNDPNSHSTVKVPFNASQGEMRAQFHNKIKSFSREIYPQLEADFLRRYRETNP